ncbi:mechanosensitive ion channel family protein [Bosea sp. 685]|uniref:mechanosensitive ion channel family protein n=1 Tax=Bosea sp. 685 TaxID=3080057 RepID=UPI0028937009|nr:mechanosensitive ion channel domain-containing protein [Bosea sp. 685]WNJ93515.1 mechanosensitive ion channel [Bosea sp. 685]
MDRPAHKPWTAAAPTQQARAALKEAAAMEPGNKGKAKPRGRASLWWYALGVLLSAALLVATAAFDVPTRGLAEPYASIALHGSLALLLTALILGGKRFADALIDKHTVDDSVTFFNLRLVIRLIAIALICLVLLSAISQTWYTVPVALGIVSVLTGFALQTPMTSFVGWVFILSRRPYRVGDRIKIAGVTGDVIDISYFDTTLWEFGGQYLSTDHPSGRIVKFPNSLVLNAPVYNYSWVLFPYIWDEIRFYVAYDSDLDFVTDVMMAVAKAEVGVSMAERVRAFRRVLDKTPVDQLDVREEPTVFFRTNDDGWLDAIVRYLVDPKEAGRIKTILTRQMLTKLNAKAGRVLFPKWR